MSTQTSSTKPANFPYSKGNQVGRDYASIMNGSNTKSVQLEPSGLVVLKQQLYMASDNGYLVSYDVSQDNLSKSWTEVHNFTNDHGYTGDKNKYDFEGITIAKGKLMLGVEGKSKNKNKNIYDPRIVRYDTANDDTTSSIWHLTDVIMGSEGGMEAMTFVPSSACPNFGGDPYYEGYFFAAYQGKQGSVYVYDLPKGNNQTDKVSALKIFSLTWKDGTSINMKASDMCFADGYLWVLFDGGGAQDELHLFTINRDSLTHCGATYLPTSNNNNPSNFPYNGNDYEGMTIDGSNLYLAIDGNASYTDENGHTVLKKLVLQYTDFNVNHFLGSGA